MREKINIIVCGAAGRMGRELIRLTEREPGLSVAAAVDTAGGEGIYKALRDYTGPADAVVDFSHRSAIGEILDYCEARNLPVVVAVTGHTPEETERIHLAATRIPVFHSANLSVGVALLARLVKQTAALFNGSDTEIVETHHNRKADAPSGTALFLADTVKSVRPNAVYVCGREGNRKRAPNEIGIHSLRLGNAAGEHEVIFSTDSQTISLKHQAHGRTVFAEGAAAAAYFIVGKPKGLYGMEDLIGNNWK